MARANPGRPARSIRFAGVLAILFGLLGAFAGLSGAATFIPYRVPNGHTLDVAEVLTAIAAAGAAVSMVGVVSGWWLLRGRGWAWRVNVVAAVGCVAAVAALAVAMPHPRPLPSRGESLRSGSSPSLLRPTAWRPCS